MRTWFKCEDPDCKCTWYDDGNNSFDGCPECGAGFYIFDEEVRESYQVLAQSTEARGQ